jgi:hypothetical protein
MKTAMKWLALIVLPLLAFIIAVPAQSAHALTVGVSDTLQLMVVGATVGTNVLTLADWAKRIDPDGKTADIVELLGQTNEIISDMLFKQGNLPTGDRATVRTGLPTVYWKIANAGVPTSKSTTQQITEQSGQLEAWSEVEDKIAEIEGDVAAFRLSEAQAFIEAMNQEFASTLIYGNGSLAPEEFTGFAVRYSSLSANNAQNIVNAGGVGADNTSIWLVVWGPNTVYGLFPKGSKAGLTHEDFGVETVQDTNGIGGNRMRAYRERWTWECGLMVRDWRYVVRIANIDISLLVLNDATSPKLFLLLSKALRRIPARGMGKPVFYANRTVLEYLDIQAQDKVSSGGQLSYDVVDGKDITMFRKIPIRTVDALLETEAAVS